ncbi:MAG TPA: 5-oxoprolinase subunit PxpB [Chitinophagales bacterium]|nr:5-oxoprolinase subunit PxpB [Chitinophagales bacterium]
MNYRYTIHPLGDSAITIDFGNLIDEATNDCVMSIFQYLRKQTIPGIRDLIPCYSSLTIVYDPVTVNNILHISDAFSFFKTQLVQSAEKAGAKTIAATTVIKIPVCYHETLAPDLNLLSVKTNLTTEEIIQLHCDKVYRVYMIGFLPGFAYMGKVDRRIAVSRKENPSPFVPSGSVGIAGEQTGIYPLDSPGGWNIIGRTPLKMFDVNEEKPVGLNPGDRVQFIRITMKEFQQLKQD